MENVPDSASGKSSCAEIPERACESQQVAEIIYAGSFCFTYTLSLRKLCLWLIMHDRESNYSILWINARHEEGGNNCLGLNSTEHLWRMSYLLFITLKESYKLKKTLMDGVFFSSDGCKINTLTLRCKAEGCSPHSVIIQRKILTALK